MKNKYRYLSKDEHGNDCHRHQILVGDTWKDVIGGSSIVGVLDKPGLVWWSSGLAMGKLGWINSKLANKQERLDNLKPYYEKIKASTEEEYLGLLDEAYKAHSVKLADSAEAGTDMHAQLEEYVKACIYNNDSKPMPVPDDGKSPKYIVDFAEWAVQDIKRFLWSEAHMYDEDLFVGGISDLGAAMKDDSYAIIDFKSSKEAYFSHFIQLAIYNLLFEKNGLVTSEGEPLPRYVYPISKYLVLPFGAKEFTVYENSNVIELKEAAKACVVLYRARANFN